MNKKIFYSCLTFLIIFSGCASAPKKDKVLELQTKVKILEKQVTNLEEKQNQLQRAVTNQAKEQKGLRDAFKRYEARKKEVENKQKRAEGPTSTQIQTALKKAGYYDGPIDGKIGPKTQEAVLKFQEENNLKVDGVVGQDTWKRLKEYLK